MAIEQPTGFELDYLFEFSPERKEGDGRLSQVGLPEFSTRFFVLAGIFQGEEARYQEGVSRGATRRPEARPYPEMRSTNKLEKSRQSARECRARKKLRYQVNIHQGFVYTFSSMVSISLEIQGEVKLFFL